MRQLKAPIIGVLAASIMVLSNPPPANATSISDYRTEHRKQIKSHDFDGFSWNQLDSGRRFSDLLSHHKSVTSAELNSRSFKGWHGPSDVFSRTPEEVIVATPEPSSLLELASVSLLSTGLWFWRRKKTPLCSQAY